MKKNILKIAVLLIALLLMAACGGSEERTTDIGEVPMAEGSMAENMTENKENVPISENSVTEVTVVEDDAPAQEKEQQVPAPKEETLGNPRSSYGLGSASFLKGKNILVSMFVTTPESGWSEAEKKEMLNKVGVAADYIEAKAADYDTQVTLCYDYTEHPSLYTEAVVDFCINEETDFIDRLDEEIARWFEEKIDYDALLTEFEGEGIATMVLVNNPGISYAIVYDGTDNVKESLVLFSGDYYNNGRDEKPITYAHEILHLFGAHDLYEEAEFTAEVTDYVKKAYPDEIMLTVTSEGNTDTAIAAVLSPITAYHLGWILETEEIILFPQLQRE